VAVPVIGYRSGRRLGSHTCMNHYWSAVSCRSCGGADCSFGVGVLEVYTFSLQHRMFSGIIAAKTFELDWQEELHV
jgi:hypothetical protein